MLGTSATDATPPLNNSPSHGAGVTPRANDSFPWDGVLMFSEAHTRSNGESEGKNTTPTHGRTQTPTANFKLLVK